MRLALLLALGCNDPAVDADDSGAAPVETDADTDADTDTDTDTDEGPDPHELGRALPAFALEDINPSSASFGQTVDSMDLAGQAFILVFLDSRCAGCHEVAVDLWALYQENPDWGAALPIFAVQSAAGMESPETTEVMVEDHDMPYLADTVDQGLWSGYDALNHDCYVVSESGTLDAWLPLWTWPEDEELFLTYMAERFGG